MAGLESIAMAVDFLERSGMQEIPSSASVADQPAEVTASIPHKSSFLNAPRRVSSESVYEETSRNISPVASSPSPSLSSPPEDLAFAETMSAQQIARLVENLSDDGEFKGPPPPPPAPTDVITRVMDFDVLCGRGGETNHHSGNVKYRALVKRYQPLYIMSKRRDKPLIASKIVRMVRHMGGRFLRKDNSNTWRDVGNTKAREKTSQALREGAPDLRSPQKVEGKQEEADNSAPSPNLDARHQPEFMGPYPPSAMGMFAGPTIVESNSGEARSSPVQKKMRLAPQPAMHGLQQFWGSAPHHHHQFMHGMGPPPTTAAPPGPPPPFMGHHHPMHVVSPADTPLGRHNPHPLMSPHSFAATISADDDDSRSSEERHVTPRSKPRGPRLKLLKRRLQEEEEKGN